MSEKKKLSLDDLNAVAGGVAIGSNKTAGIDEFFSAKDIKAFNDFCLNNSITGENKRLFEKNLNTKGVLSIHFNGDTWEISN